MLNFKLNYLNQSELFDYKQQGVNLIREVYEVRYQINKTKKIQVLQKDIHCVKKSKFFDKYRYDLKNLKVNLLI